MKTSQVYGYRVILRTLLDKKGAVGLKIARNLRMIDEELVEYDNARLEIFKKYGTEENGIFKIERDSENYSSFLEEIEPLDNQEIELNFRKLTDEEIEKSDLTAQQILLLEFME